MNSRVHAELPDSFTATYALHYDDLRIGVMERRFTHNKDGTGTFDSHAKLTGLAALFRKDQITEISRWETNNEQLRPVEYKYERIGGNGGLEEKEHHLFDWQNNKVVSTIDEAKRVLNTNPGLLDKLLYQLAMMVIKDPDKSLKYDLIDGLTLKTYQFKFQGEEELSTPMGKINARIFHRQRPENDTSKRTTTLWCAPSLHYLPIRVDVIDEKGHLTSIVIKEVSGLK